jgi:hypothetical protein
MAQSRRTDGRSPGCSATFAPSRRRRARRQWLMRKRSRPSASCDATTAYRCGGSAGSLGDSSRRFAPASRFTVAAQQGPHGTISVGQSISGAALSALMRGKRAGPSHQGRGDTIARMLEDLEALRGKLTELHARVRMLREENQQLRAQVSSAQVELDVLRGRVSGAVRRVDELLARLPSTDAGTGEPERASSLP